MATRRTLIGVALLAVAGGCSSGLDELPIADQVVLAALDEAHSGDLGGLRGADNLCQQQAERAGRKETFLAFISSKDRNVKEIVDEGIASVVPVLNTKGEQMFSSWNRVFTSSRWSGEQLYTFSGLPVAASSDVDPPFYMGSSWHGSLQNGSARNERTCKDWNSSSSIEMGAAGDIDSRQLIGSRVLTCDKTLAVVCAGAASLPTFGSCPTPGEPCEGDDPCAVDPICGEDRKCRPRRMQDCSDGLLCTEDVCLGDGGCDNTLKADACMIAGKCYKDGERDEAGCSVCDASKDQNVWSPADNACRIGNQCFEDGEKDPSGCRVCDPNQSTDGWTEVTGDLCKIGGMCYEPGEKHPDACGVCDPEKSVVSWSPSGTDCLINGECYPEGATDATGCNGCVPNQSQTSWSPMLGDLCKIGGKCYQPGDKHPELCAECDPTITAIGWTPKGNDCLINNQCHSAGVIDSTGCNSCDPATSKTSWTPLSGSICKIGSKCYQTGEKHPAGCAECDPAISAIAWTPKGNDCLINNACYPSGSIDPTGCSSCDPATSKTSWTALSGSICKIGNNCYQPAEKHPDGCAECDPSVSLTDWTPKGNDCYINNACYALGALEPLVGCSGCDPAISKTSWTPIPGCYKKIVLSALNNAHTGSLGGVAGADALCQAQAAAAGVPGTFKAFLSTATQDVKDMIIGANATAMAVVNTKGEQLFSSWNQIFATTYWSSGRYLYAFDGKRVDENTGASPDWLGARGWHGSNADGTYKAGTTCLDWSSELTTENGVGGDLDSRRLMGQYTQNCGSTLAVVCVMVGP